MANNVLPPSKLQVVPDNFTGPLPLYGITQSDYNNLNQALQNIHNGSGMTINSDSGELGASQREDWDEMMMGTIENSPSFRDLITRIGNNPNVNIPVNLTSGNPYFTGDDLATKRVDIFDQYSLPLNAPANDPNNLTRGESVMHLLAERYMDNILTNEGVTFKNPAEEYETAHGLALAYDNAYRAEQGQLPVTAINEDPRGTIVLTYLNPDGTTVQGNPIKVDSMIPGKYWPAWEQMKNSPPPSDLDPSVPALRPPRSDNSNEGASGDEGDDNDQNLQLPSSGEGPVLALNPDDPLSDPQSGGWEDNPQSNGFPGESGSSPGDGQPFPASLNPETGDGFPMQNNGIINTSTPMPDTGENNLPSINDGFAQDFSAPATDKSDFTPDSAEKPADDFASISQPETNFGSSTTDIPSTPPISSFEPAESGFSSGSAFSMEPATAEGMEA